MADVRNGNLGLRIPVRKRDEIGLISLHLNKMLDNLQSILHENYIIQLREKEAQIQTLKSQINPHFLYNTLDTINWMVVACDSRVNEMVTSLSGILRYSISHPIDIVALKEEIYQLNHYLNIQKIRYEDQIEFITDIDPDTEMIKIHKLLIQPLVKNAIQHGMKNKEQEGIIRISSYLRNSKLIVEVFDNGEGFPEAIQRQVLSVSSSLRLEDGISHIGLNNVHQRLRYYYGEQYGLEIDSSDRQFTKVRLVLLLTRWMASK